MPIREINMDEHHKELIDGVSSDFQLIGDEANAHYRVARAEQAPHIVPVSAFNTADFHPVVHTEVAPQPAFAEAGPKHRLGEKPKVVKSLVNAAKIGLKLGS